MRLKRKTKKKNFREKYKFYKISKGVKPFACSLCDNSFARLSALKIHQRIHTGILTFLFFLPVL